jgi:hypothetical protein
LPQEEEEEEEEEEKGGGGLAETLIVQSRCNERGSVHKKYELQDWV